MRGSDGWVALMTTLTVEPTLLDAGFSATPDSEMVHQCVYDLVRAVNLGPGKPASVELLLRTMTAADRRVLLAGSPSGGGEDGQNTQLRDAVQRILADGVAAGVLHPLLDGYIRFARAGAPAAWRRMATSDSDPSRQTRSTIRSMTGNPLRRLKG